MNKKIISFPAVSFTFDGDVSKPMLEVHVGCETARISSDFVRGLVQALKANKEARVELERILGVSTRHDYE